MVNIFINLNIYGIIFLDYNIFIFFIFLIILKIFFEIIYIKNSYDFIILVNIIILLNFSRNIYKI